MNTSYSQTLERLEQQGNLRLLRETSNEGKHIVHNGVRYLNLSSNDYLGIACSTTLQAAFLSELHHSGSFVMGSASSRLLTGNAPAYRVLEQRLAGLFGRGAALTFNSGYHANIGILPALATRHDLILADKLVHASIIDGLRLCEARWERYRHNDMAHLEILLQKRRGEYERIFIVTESVFSMDGDLADLAALCDLKEQYGATLYVDEAHAFGAMGQSGLGLCEATGTIQRVDLIVGTFGKAAASQGAYLIADSEVKELLVNSQRSLIFTTAQPEINVLWTDYVVQLLAQMCDERARLAHLSHRLRSELTAVGVETRGCSHIVPVVTGDNQAAVALSQRLQRSGFWVLPIRYPTVPKGEARVRLSLNPNVTESEVIQLVKEVELWKQNG